MALALAQLEELDLSQQLEALEVLWRSISRNEAQVPSPAWHGEVLARRMEDLESGTAEVVSLEDAEKDLGLR